MPLPSASSVNPRNPSPQVNQGAYFKSEQEAELQRHRDRLVREGAIDKAVPRSDPKSVSESLHAYEASSGEGEWQAIICGGE